MRILIAEDNALYRAVLNHHIETWGYEAVLAKDGVQALEILQRDDAPRLVLLDWQMPGMDGIDVCRAVKRNPEHPFTYVVMLTSRDAQEDMVTGLNAGAMITSRNPLNPKYCEVALWQPSGSSDSYRRKNGHFLVSRATTSIA